MTRLRLRYAKVGKVRFTSHRDVARMWERALRRAEVPVAYSVGFSPHPRVSFGLALSTGHEGLAEYLDCELAAGAQPDLAALPEVLTAALPAGVTCTAVAVLAPGSASLQEVVTSCSWELEVEGTTPAELAEAVAAFLDASRVEVTRERKGQAFLDDVRGDVAELAVAGATPDGQAVLLTARLHTLGRALRPAELLTGLLPGRPVRLRRALRTHQWIDDGAPREVLPLAAPIAPALEACA
jgi:radical SAM-linked protein